MIPIPKFRLGTIFLLFVCYSLGLAMARDMVGAIEPTIAVAILIGLTLETRQLLRWTPPLSPPRASFTFARSFAIFWRCVIGLVIFWQVSQDFIQVAFPPLPAPADFSSNLLRDFSMVSGYFPPLRSFCILIVLANSIDRWRPKAFISSTPQRRTNWLVILAVPLATIALLQATFIMYLVHSAVSGIEAAQLPRFHRPGAYTTPVDEGLLSFWLSSLAVLSLLTGAAVLFRFIRRRNFAFASLWSLAAATPLLATSAIFSAWFLTTKFKELSPEMFESGFEATRIDWIYGCVWGVVLADLVAHRIACSREFCEPPIIDTVEHPERIPFHQASAILILIGTSSLYGLFMVGQIAFTANPILPQPVWSGIVNSLSEPLMLLLLAQAIAGLQFCWIRWKYRSQPVPWRLAALSRPAYYEGFIATLLLLAVGIPTLHAFSFVCWLMPWNVKALFGF